MATEVKTVGDLKKMLKDVPDDTVVARAVKIPRGTDFYGNTMYTAVWLHGVWISDLPVVHATNDPNLDACFLKSLQGCLGCVVLILALVAAGVLIYGAVTGALSK